MIANIIYTIADMTETQKNVLVEAVWGHKNIIAAGGTRSGNDCRSGERNRVFENDRPKRKLEQIVAVDGWDYEREQYVIRELA